MVETSGDQKLCTNHGLVTEARELILPRFSFMRRTDWVVGTRKLTYLFSSFSQAQQGDDLSPDIHNTGQVWPRCCDEPARHLFSRGYSVSLARDADISPREKDMLTYRSDYRPRIWELNTVRRFRMVEQVRRHLLDDAG